MGISERWDAGVSRFRSGKSDLSRFEGNCNSEGGFLKARSVLSAEPASGGEWIAESVKKPRDFQGFGCENRCVALFGE